MADDDDTIFIDVVPKLDDSAADSAVNKLKDKFQHAGDGLTGVLDHLSDKMGPLAQLGDKMHEAISGAFSPKDLDSLGQRAGTALGQGVSEALKDVTHGDFGNILGEFGKVGDVLGGVVDKLSGKLDSLNKAGGAIGNVLSGSGSGNDLNDILSGAKGLGFNIPGPINDISHVNDIVNKMNEHPGQTEDWLDKNFGFVLNPLDDIINKGPQVAGNWLAENTWASPSPTRDAASDKWSSSVANEVSIDASSAVISAGSVSLGGSISLPGLPTGNSLAGSSGGSGRTTSSGIARAGDSGGMESLYSGPSILGKGFAGGGVVPGDAPGYDNAIGVLPSGGMVGLEGTEGVVNPKAMSRPGIADLVTQLNKGFDAGTGGPGGVGGDPNNTTLSTPPTTPNNAGGGNGPIQPQQFGSGQGGGVSGGGIIGAAEQAGVAAAGIAGFGGGSIAAQMAVQESNLAVQKTTQMVAALATAPFETFGLGGGMMGAPQVNPMGGWIGKLVGGALGQMNQIPNIAGSVQPPKKPDEKPDDQQPQGESPSGPSGDRDDPMHVKVTNPPQAQQGSATSAMSTLPAMTMSVP